MKIVWISRWDPRDPTDGLLLYTKGLLDGIAAAGARATVITCARPRPAGSAESRAESGIDIRLFPPRGLWRGWSLFTPLQSDAFRHRSRAMADAIRQAVTADVDAVVFDYFSTGWALPIVLERCRALGRERPVIVYVSHNHETTLRRRVAGEYGGNPLLKPVLWLDALKAARLEHALVSGADIVTANTGADLALFAAEAPDKTYLTLVPGYSGRVEADREITPDLPRRVLMMGSLVWIAKQDNLRRFVAAAEQPFRDAGIELVVLGRSDPAFMKDLEAGSGICRCIGFVDDLEPWLRSSRIGLMPDEIGGGFKHRYLHYIFNGIPVATIRSATAGLPLDPERAMIVGGTSAELARAIVAAIDDLPLLNEKRRLAFESCRSQFDWKSRGQALTATIRAVAERLSA